MKILLFDIDGTLLKTGGAGKLAFERVFEELFDVTNAWGRLIPDGKTDPAIIQELARKSLKRHLNAVEYRKVCRHYLKYFKVEIQSANFRLMPGVPDLIRRLSRRSDILLGLATGNFEEASWVKLRKANLHSYFRFGGFGSDSSDRVELTHRAIQRGRRAVPRNRSVQEVYVIGDSVHDIRAGKHLGVRTVAVATGSTSLSDLKACKPDHLLQHLNGLESVMKIFI